MDRADELLAARPAHGGVAGASARVFYAVPLPDAADFRQWVFGTPPNCKSEQSACRASVSVLDGGRRDPQPRVTPDA
jgi:hypothetical protein